MVNFIFNDCNDRQKAAGETVWADFLHQHSTRLVHAFDRIGVGAVNAAALAQTRLAKSVLDAGWSTFRSFD